MRKSVLIAALLLAIPAIAGAQQLSTKNALHPIPMFVGTGGHSVSLTWTPSSDAVSNPTLAYNVYRTTAATCPTTLAGYTKIGSSSTASFNDTGLQPGAYCYVVTATLNGAESAMSNSAPAVPLPSPPTSLSATPQ